MDSYQNYYLHLPGISPEELEVLQRATAELSENQKKQFYILYSGRRKAPQDMLIFCIVGLCLVPGLQRFVTGQIGMGILYLFTAGLCIIGSVVDLINYKTFALDYNKKMAYESLQLAKLSQ